MTFQSNPTYIFTHNVMHKNYNMMVTIGNSYYDINPHMAFKWACLHGDMIATKYIYNMFMIKYSIRRKR